MERKRNERRERGGEGGRDRQAQREEDDEQVKGRIINTALLQLLPLLRIG